MYRLLIFLLFITSCNQTSTSINEHEKELNDVLEDLNFTLLHSALYSNFLKMDDWEKEDFTLSIDIDQTHRRILEEIDKAIELLSQNMDNETVLNDLNDSLQSLNKHMAPALVSYRKSTHEPYYKNVQVFEEDVPIRTSKSKNVIFELITLKARYMFAWQELRLHFIKRGKNIYKWKIPVVYFDKGNYRIGEKVEGMVALISYVDFDKDSFKITSPGNELDFDSHEGSIRFSFVPKKPGLHSIEGFLIKENHFDGAERHNFKKQIEILE